MSYVERSLVPGETLLYETRHHWMVLIGPLLMALVFVAVAAGLLVEAVEAKNGSGMVAGASAEAMHGMEFVAIALLAAAIGTLAYGVAKRNATEMAVTDRDRPQPRVLVVDDEEHITELVAMGLGFNGFEVGRAGSGRDFDRPPIELTATSPRARTGERHGHRHEAPDRRHRSGSDEPARR